MGAGVLRLVVQVNRHAIAFLFVHDFDQAAHHAPVAFEFFSAFGLRHGIRQCGCADQGQRRHQRQNEAHCFFHGRCVLSFDSFPGCMSFRLCSFAAAMLKSFPTGGNTGECRLRIGALHLLIRGEKEDGRGGRRFFRRKATSASRHTLSFFLNGILRTANALGQNK